MTKWEGMQREWGKKRAYRFCWVNLKGRCYFEELGTGGDDNELGIKEMCLVSVDWIDVARDKIR